LAKSKTDELARLASELLAERQELAARLEEIDSTFSGLGLTPPSTGTPARRTRGKAADKPAGKTTRRRGKFKQNAEQAILSFVESTGTPTTKQINELWTRQGRAGKADNTLSRLVKEGKIVRENIPGARGSHYHLP